MPASGTAKTLLANGLLQSHRAQGRRSGTAAERPSLEKEVKSLVQTLPDELSTRLLGHPDLGDLVEIVLDLGRHPQANFGKHRDHIRKSLVSAEELEHVVSRVGAFGDDNRAGIEGTLHRVSSIRDRGGAVIGLTLAVGKPVIGPAALLEDILQDRKSVLILGPPGIGKTTVLRDVARVMSSDMGRKVMIVDTSNEIGGYGNIPHPFIGESRRIQVPNIDEQYNVMVEAVQNHRPEVIVVDEVGRREEVDACRSISQRGVQIIATVHGYTLENLVKNPQLVGLVGGIQTVTVGDITAIKRAGDADIMRKTVREREGPSTFDVLVEMRSREEWHIHDVEESVDLIMKGQQAVGEVRFLDLATGVTQHPTDDDTAPDMARTSTAQIEEENDAREALRSILEEFVSKRIEVMGLSLTKANAKKLHTKTMKSTEKKAAMLLSRPDELSKVHAQSTLDSSAIPLLGTLESWVRGQAGNHGVHFKKAQCQVAAQLLAAHVAHTVQQQISSQAPKQSNVVTTSSKNTSGSQNKQSDLVATSSKNTLGVAQKSKNDALVSQLGSVLGGLIESRKPEWGKKRVKLARPKLVAEVIKHLVKMWNDPTCIGNRKCTAKINTEVQKKVFERFETIVREAGRGVKGVNEAKIKSEALHLTGLSMSLLGTL